MDDEWGGAAATPTATNEPPLNPTTMDEPSSNYKDGQKIQVCGLVERPDLNARRGTILNFDDDQARYIVRLDGSGEMFALRALNLQTVRAKGALRPVLRLQPLEGELHHHFVPKPTHAICDSDDGTVIVSSGNTVHHGGSIGCANHQIEARDAHGNHLIFDGARGLAIGSNAIYVADCNNDRVVVLDRDLKYRTHWPGLQSPIGVVLHGERAYVTEHETHAVAVCTMATGEVEFRFSGDGQLRTPWGIAVHGDTLFVADSWSDRIARFTLDGDWLEPWGVAGGGLGQFRMPVGLAVCNGALIVSVRARVLDPFAPVVAYCWLITDALSILLGRRMPASGCSCSRWRTARPFASTGRRPLSVAHAATCAWSPCVPAVSSSQTRATSAYLRSV